MVRKSMRVVGSFILILAAPVLGGEPARDDAHRENAVAYAPDGKWLVTGGSDGKVRIRDGNTGEVQAVLAGHKAGVDVKAVAVSPDGRTIASASNDLTARLWDVERRIERRVIRTPETPSGWGQTILTVAFAPDGLTLATGDAGDVMRIMATRIPGKGFDRYATDDDVGHIRLWDVGTGKLTGSWVADSGRVDQVLFSPDGATIASAGSGPAIKLWDARTHAPRRTLDQPGQSRLHLAYAPDGTTLAASRDAAIVLWDPATGARKDSFQPDFEYAANLAFTPDGAYLAAAGYTGWSRLCSIKPRTDGGNRCSAIIETQADGISCSGLAISPDGRWVAHCFFQGTRSVPKPNFKLIGIR